MAKLNFKKLPFKQIAAGVGGAVASFYAVGLANKAIPNSKPEIRQAVPVILGLFLATRKNPIIKGIGVGMATKGAYDFVISKFPAIKGIGMSEDDYFRPIQSPMNQSALSSPMNQSALSSPYIRSTAMDEERYMMKEYQS